MNDREALFASWMSQHGAGLRRVARSYARGAADQEDLAQDVALAIWNALPGFRGESSERTFLYRIAHLRGVTHLARRRLDGESTEETEVADTRPGPEHEVRDREQVERLFAALRTLPVPQRQVLTLALEGLSHKEIGDCLGTPPCSFSGWDGPPCVTSCTTRAAPGVRPPCSRWRRWWASASAPRWRCGAPGAALVVAPSSCSMTSSAVTGGGGS